MAEIILGPGNRPAPSLLNQATAGKVPGVVTTTSEQLFAMSRKSSLWMLSFGLACCAIEMISTYMAHHDFDRFGVVTWPSPRQSDVMIVAGTVDEVKRQIDEIYSEIPFEYFSLVAYNGLEPQAQLIEDIEMFATKVAPAFADA